LCDRARRRNSGRLRIAIKTRPPHQCSESSRDRYCRTCSRTHSSPH
jgi:hypothetical protein